MHSLFFVVAALFAAAGGPPRPLSAEANIAAGPGGPHLSPDEHAAIVLEPPGGTVLIRLDSGQLQKLPGIALGEFVAGWAGRDALYVRDRSPVPHFHATDRSFA